MQPWKTLSRSVVLRPNAFLSVEVHSLELPGGRIIDDWYWLDTPDFVNVLARTTDGRFLCFRQTKYGLQGDSLAPIGGLLEPSEDPLSGVKRELLEETGYAAGRWIPLGSYRVDPNRGNGTAHLFLALDARPEGPCVPGDLEEQELVLLTRDEVELALRAGEFKALAWTTVVALGLERLRNACDESTETCR